VGVQVHRGERDALGDAERRADLGARSSRARDDGREP